MWEYICGFVGEEKKKVELKYKAPWCMTWLYRGHPNHAVLRPFSWFASDMRREMINDNIFDRKMEFCPLVLSALSVVCTT